MEFAQTLADAHQPMSGPVDLHAIALFVLKMQKENAGAGRRSCSSTHPKSPRLNLEPDQFQIGPRKFTSDSRNIVILAQILAQNAA